MPSIEQLFPNLARTGYTPTSPASQVYNCLAWALGDDANWWEPAGSYYWPPDLPREDTIQTVGRIFEQRGYVQCDTDAFEPGFEKVAIYGDDDGFLHAARQLGSGRWTSKLGRLVDIEHLALEGLAGKEYGSPRLLMRRPVPTAPTVPGSPARSGPK
jgi:hypothetical protein